ncbi:YidC/Oxa1 family membrane protein insertase [Persephonella hydrogeniphila]|uniref:Membrane protein insertase YidC n=1 Tax=Persephonella hydrogeniphila TaxID=198703 RepID=A0A285NB52_9AQUI|nr:membrane protein insertase YidC [Persephonella hydrogeniphila]SNZ06660.1 YidC/Oxa1 family membrane protein insertase [Persephonella hydrogeniphila]
MNQENDLQKRMLIFFVVVAVLMIGFSAVSSFFFTGENKATVKQEVAEKTQTAEKTESPKNTDVKNQEKTPQVLYSTGGSYNLLLGSRRVNADNLQDLVSVKTDFGEVKISKVGGRIVSIYIDRYKIDIISDFSKRNRIFPTEIITTDPQMTEFVNFSRYDFRKDGNRLIFTLKKNGIRVEKEFIIDGSIFLLNIKTEGLEKLGLSVVNGITLEEAGKVFGHSGAVIKTDKELIKIDQDIEREQIIRGNILWAGEENKYFIQMLATKTGFTATHIIPVAKEKTVVLSEIPPSINGFFFGGPKLYSLLENLTDKYKKEWGKDLSLQDTVDFGIFGILGKPLFIVLHFFYNYTHNWGVAIILLTVLIRIIFFPLNHKSLKAMKKMADLAPEIKKLQKKYKDDPQKLQQEMMKLYAEHGANPMSGCLPIIVQIPVFIALYNVLMVTVELKNAPFMLWITDLSSKDPYYILPILMGLSMVAQQWITPSSDKNQKMIMYIMAAVFTFMFMNFPSGLVLYWLTNNILGLLQSYFINKKIGRYEKK